MEEEGTGEAIGFRGERMIKKPPEQFRDSGPRSGACWEAVVMTAAIGNCHDIIISVIELFGSASLACCRESGKRYIANLSAPMHDGRVSMQFLLCLVRQLEFTI